MDAPVKVAGIQAEPVILDREATIDKLAALAAEAAGTAPICPFPEAFVPAYPSSGLGEGAQPAGPSPAALEAFALLARESVAVPGEAEARRSARLPARRRLARHRRHRDRPRAAPTLYNTLLDHAPDGTLALKHRKLVPTNHERLIWGQGDGEGLRDVLQQLRPDRRPDLPGELHAARALRALRVRRRDLPRPDRR